MDAATKSSKYFTAPAQYMQAKMIRKRLFRFEKDSSISMSTPDFVIFDRKVESSSFLLGPL